MKFFECLKNAKDKIAKQIGFTYFSVLGPQCFKMDYPIEDCQATRKYVAVNFVVILGLNMFSVSGVNV